MAIFEVPTEAAIAAAEVNKVKRLRIVNHSFVYTYDQERTVDTTPTALRLFPHILIPAGKLLHVDLHVPIHNINTSWGGAYINLSVEVTGKNINKKWYDLGTTGTNSDTRTTGKNTINMHRQTKVLDLPGWLGLGYEPRDVYTVQFLVSASSNYGTFDVNKSCFINDDILTKTATTINKPEPMKQNFMRLIVREMS
jgi:hypothetical protein